MGFGVSCGVGCAAGARGGQARAAPRRLEQDWGYLG